MKWSEESIGRALARQTFNRKHLVVVPNCNWTGHEADLLVVPADLRVIDVEVKISRADLKADAKKDKWWHREFRGYEPDETVEKDGRIVRINRRRVYDETARVWPPRVWKHYYVLPKDLWDDALFASLPSPASGVLLVAEQKSVAMPVAITCVRPPKPNRDADRLTPAAAVDIARLASLRMWDAFADRDRAVEDHRRTRLLLSAQPA